MPAASASARKARSSSSIASEHHSLRWYSRAISRWRRASGASVVVGSVSARAGGGVGSGVATGGGVGWRVASTTIVIATMPAAIAPTMRRLRASSGSVTRVFAVVVALAVGAGWLAAAPVSSGTLASAADSSSADCQRPFGSLASAFSTTASSSAEIGAPTVRGGAGSVCRWSRTTSSGSGRMNGRRPTSSSYSTTPSAYKSLRASAGLPDACSGLR